jgi:hypothetical protein
MNMYLEEWLARDRLDEARALAARLALVRGLASARRPVRVAVGLALIRTGHWVAGRGPRGAGQPSRVTA